MVYDTSMKESLRKKLYAPACMLLLMLCAYILLHDLLGGTLFCHSDWDSYTLQALAWRAGRLDLGQNYEWLELAVYNGKYFVSFPQTPALFMLPLTFLFGADTPNNFIMMLAAMGIAVCAYAVCRKLGMQRLQSALLALFYIWGCNMLWMSTNGGVWFQAQGWNMLLLSLTLLCALYERWVPAYLFAALAVGCRPFSVCAFVPLTVYFLERAKGLKKSLRTLLPCLILPALVACAYMALNYARFGSVFEFGHNYLPEFTASEHGQFSTVYLWSNLKNLFLRPVTFQNGRLSFTFFDGFMFYIANPLFLILFIRLLRGAFQKSVCPEWRLTRAALLFAMAAELVLLCLHKTLGGWQFGARYTVDLLPMALGCLFTLGKWEIESYEYALMGFGIAFNFYGCIAINLFT